MSATAPTLNPFLGLRRFEIADAALFFGRNDQSYELLRRLDALHFVAVIGPSGCGKSSLVRAGVLAPLQQGYLAEGGPWKIATLQPGGAPLAAWVAALTPFVRPGADPARLAVAPLEVLDTSAGRIAILVDQFEELFQFGDRTGRRQEVADFLAAMLSTGTDDGGVYVMLTMRSEFLLQCAAHPDLAAAINEGLYLVPRMTRDQLRQAVVGPLQRAGAAITVQLLDRLLDDASQEEDGLPVLQHALSRMWPQRDPFAPLGIALYPQEGGLGALLDAHADKVFQRLPAADQGLAEAVFRRITERTRDGRIVRSARTLQSIADDIDVPTSSLMRCVQPFVDEGLLVLLPADGSPLVDILHEAVARRWRRLSGWIHAAARQREAAAAITEAAREWDRNGRDKSYLFGGQKLVAAQFELGASTRPFAPQSLESRFLDASRQVDWWAQMRSPRVLGTVALLLAVVIGLVIWGVVGQVQVERAAAARAVAAAEAEAAAARSRADETQRTLAAATQARVAETQLTLKSRAAPPAGTQARLYPQVWSAAQAEQWRALVGRLPADRAYQVQAAQIVSVGPDTNELRYFRRDEKDAADAIARDLTPLLGTLGVVYVGGYETSDSIRPNHFELWLARPQAAPAPVPAALAVVLYLNPAQRDAAQRLGDQLGGDYGVRVRSYPAVSWPFVAPAEVHYFSKADAAEAERLADRLRRQQPGIVSRYMAVSNPLPPRYFEVWLRGP